MNRKNLTIIGIIAAIVAAAAAGFGSNYVLFTLTFILIYSVLIISLNMIVGYLGILQLAHPAIYGLGAYLYGYFSIQGMPFLATIAIAGTICGVIGTLLALPSIKLRGHYIAMSTLAFLLIANGIFVNWKSFTNGQLGLKGIPRPEIFGFGFTSTTEFFILTAAISLILWYLLHRILHSPFSKVIEMTREDETAAMTLGKDTIRYKLTVFAVSSFVAGVGGSMLAAFLRFISPVNFTLDELIIILSMVIIGGMASFWGSILGAAIITLIPEILKFALPDSDLVGPLRFMTLGILIIFFMLYRPNGILGKRTNVFSK